MERFAMSRNKNLINNEYYRSSKLEKENLEFGLSSYKLGGFIEVTSQEEMITDSLMACLQMSPMSKCRSLKRSSDVSGKIKTRLTSETFNQCQKETPLSKENTKYVSHMLRQDNWYKKFKEWNSIISQEVLISNNPKKCSSKELPGTASQKTSKGKVQADTIWMVDLVLGELQTLTTLAPSVSKTAAKLSKWVSHYKECARCHEKISLLEILHRIQELNLYIANKRKKTHSRSTQSKEEEEKSNPPLREHSVIKSESFKETVEEESRERQVEKSRVLDPASIAEGNPGVQILLEVELEKQKFYQTVGSGLWEIQNVNFSATQVNDFSYSSEAKKPEISRHLSLDFVIPKLYSIAVLFAPTFFARSPDSLLVLNNHIETSGTLKRILEKATKIAFLNKVPLCDKQSLPLTENFCVVFFKKIGCLSVPRILGQRSESLYSNESSDSLQYLLKELYERMESKIVDEEVTVLRNLISEVQKNQVKLSKVLLNEGIFSQPLIKLTNPNLLEEESKTLKRISEFGNSSSVSTSLDDDLQDTLNNVKEKCNFKNRLIGTVTRGLHHNVPKEWWEEIVGYAFDGSNTLSGNDYEKVDNLLRQCTSYFGRREKALVQQGEEGREDERILEEETNLRDFASGITQGSSKTFPRWDERLVNLRDGWAFSDLEASSTNQPMTNEQLLNYQSTSQQSPRENQTNVRNRWMKSLENQISMLSVENTKLWEEIQALRDSVENSAKDVSIKKTISVSNRQSFQDTYGIPGKTINVTVQISSDRMARRPKEHQLIKLHRYSNTAEDGHSRTSKISLKQAPEYSRKSEHRDPSSSRKSNYPDSKGKLYIKSERRRSQNDLNYLDDFIPSAAENLQDNRDYMVLAKERVIHRESAPIVQQMAISENPEVYNFLKGTNSQESQKSPRAGPSHRNLEVDYLLQRPSLVKLGGGQTSGMQATMSNERELQPIMENDHPDFASSFCSSSSLCQAVQQLRARVRSIHKEVTVLKSKNDRIDKLLDKLLDDAVDNNKSFEEIENNLKNLNRLD